MALTGRCGLLALILVVPVAASARPALTFEVFLLTLTALVAVDVAFSANPRRLRYTRFPDGSIRLGQSVDAGLRIHNDGRRPFRGQVRDAWPPSARCEPRAHHLVIGPGQSRVVIGRLHPIRRGDQHAAEVTARSIGPLGLAGRQRSQPVAGHLRVLPPFLSRKHLPSRLAKLQEIDGLLPTLIRGQGTEFDSLREYVVGDDVRSIDWRASARRTEVMVRTWRPERDRRVVVVLDTGRMAAGRVGVDPTAADPAGWPRLDWAMDAALLLAALATRAGDHVDFLAHDRIARAAVFGASRTELLATLVEAMAPLQPELIESDWRAMTTALLRRIRRRCLVVLLTDLNPAALDEGLLPALPQLSARHHVLVAAIADPRVDQLAAGRSDAAAIYDAAAAERSRNERRGIASRLRRSGVEVLDAPPSQIAPELADRYLAMKMTGKL
ncbi:DUF58 domain-containing protein [Mycobacterium sp.]|uniref:DUF58 domain-containing protein n=1 Tax=Mycobacterium sp. TaxID=1785 RepID=UPI003A839EC7